MSRRVVHVEHARTPHPTERVRDGPAVRVPTSGTAPLRPRAGPRRVAWRRRTRVTGPAERAGGRPPAAVRARKDPTDSRHLDHGDLRRGNDDTGPGAPALAEGRESTRPPAFTSDRARRPLIGGDDCVTCSTHPALIKTTSRRGAITTPSWSAAAPRRRRRGAQSRGPTVRIGPGPTPAGRGPRYCRARVGPRSARRSPSHGSRQGAPVAATIEWSSADSPSAIFPLHGATRGMWLRPTGGSHADPGTF